MKVKLMFESQTGGAGQRTVRRTRLEWVGTQQTTQLGIDTETLFAFHKPIFFEVRQAFTIIKSSVFIGHV